MFREMVRDLWELIRDNKYAKIVVVIWLFTVVAGAYTVVSTFNDCGARWTSFTEYGVQYHFFTGKCLYAD